MKIQQCKIIRASSTNALENSTNRWILKAKDEIENFDRVISIQFREDEKYRTFYNTIFYEISEE